MANFTPASIAENILSTTKFSDYRNKIQSSLAEFETNTNDALAVTFSELTADPTYGYSIDTINSQIATETKTFNNHAQAQLVASGIANRKDKKDAFVFDEVVGNEYKAANTDKYVNLGGDIQDTYGEELVVDTDGTYIGDFSNGLTGWSYANTIVDNSTVVCTNTSTYYSAYIQKTIAATIGKIYKIEVSRKYIDDPALFVTFDNVVLIGGVSGILESKLYTFYSISSTINPTLKISGRELYKSTVFDNISVKEITTVDMTAYMPNVRVETTTNTTADVALGDYVVLDKPELVIGDNSTFDTSIGNWLASGDVTATVDVGRLKLTLGTDDYSAVVQTFSVTVGILYAFRCEAETGTAFLKIALDYGSALVYSSNINGEYITTFTPTADTVSVRLQVQDTIDGTYGFFDNISLKQVDDIYRAKQLAPATTPLHDTTYFEPRDIVTNQILIARKTDGTLYYETLLVDIYAEDSLNALMTNNGFSKLENGLYSKGSDVVTPIAIWQSLNKGAYHPVYNSLGTRLIDSIIPDNSRWQWFKAEASTILSVSDSFTKAETVYAAGSDNESGKVTSSVAAARPDSKFYDIIYEDQFIDLRVEATKANQYDLLSSVDSKLKSGDIGGAEGGVETYATGDRSGNPAYISLGASKCEIYMPYGTALKNFTIGEWVTITSITPIFVAKFKIETIIESLDLVNDFIQLTAGTLSDNNFRLLHGVFPEGNIDIIFVTKETPVLSQGTKLSVDVIGNPISYPQDWLDMLASGKPLPFNPLLVEA